MDINLRITYHSTQSTESRSYGLKSLSILFDNLLLQDNVHKLHRHQDQNYKMHHVPCSLHNLNTHYMDYNQIYYRSDPRPVLAVIFIAQENWAGAEMKPGRFYTYIP